MHPVKFALLKNNELSALGRKINLCDCCFIRWTPTKK